jgi:hypothetical protein
MYFFGVHCGGRGQKQRRSKAGRLEKITTAKLVPRFFIIVKVH